MISKNTVILTVHNKEATICAILGGLVSTLSRETSRVIIVLDGCTDRTKELVESFISDAPKRFIFSVEITDDVWETKANNVGLRLVDTEYATIVQDDMLLKEHFWDVKLIKVFEVADIFAVSGRAAHNFSFDNGKFRVTNLIGREYPFGSKGVIARIAAKILAKLHPYWIYKYYAPLSFRLTVNRGPLVMRTGLLRKLDFFDEAFAPFELDDVDLCCRAYKSYGLFSATRPIYYEEIGGSKTNNSHSANVSNLSIEKNTKILVDRHSDLVELS